ncbi:hypothetical protein FOA52_001056 [Chlamydomonas sp. UWO 241]|nr:hypothetical protein FOA52_001056 [Chlamydomonas sp. UWO 241]
MQVLAPSLVGRGRHFGSATSLKSEWVCVDQPYFSAPGVELFPLSPRDLVPTAVLAREQQPVAVAFICVEGGKVWAATHRDDARVVQRGLLLLTRHLLREVPGGYLVKEQSGELKIMLAFRSGRVAHLFLAAMQEAAMAIDWPAAAQKQWPRVDGPDGLPLFNGPRLKMGVCAGHPRSIMPDYLGRADYLGDAVNQVGAKLFGRAAAAESEESPSRPSRLQPGTQGIEGDGPWPANALVDGGFDELLITDIGSFRFKGSLQVLPMVNVCLASLAKRTLPREPPKGKGGRVRDGTGAPLARVRVPLLTALHRYRQRLLALPSAAAVAAAAAAEAPHRSAPSFARAATLVMRGAMLLVRGTAGSARGEGRVSTANSMFARFSGPRTSGLASGKNTPPSPSTPKGGGGVPPAQRAPPPWAEGQSPGRLASSSGGMHFAANGAGTITAGPKPRDFQEDSMV